MTATVDFVMPSLGADMDEGTITEWLITVGDTIDRGDVVAIVETDKADIDIEVWHDGVVAEILVPPGELVAVGTPLARLEVADATPGHIVTPPPQPAPEPEPPSDATALPPTPAPQPTPISQPTPSIVVGADGRDRVAASPLARRLAAERRIDLATVAGSGPGGAVTARDLAASPAPAARRTSAPMAEAPPVELPPEQAAPADQGERMRRAIAELMARSKREIPHYYLATDIDVEAALRWLETVNAERTLAERILPAALMLKAVAVAAAGHPELNGFWVDGRFQPGSGVHLGVAVSLRGGGLVAPAVHDADQASIPELMARLRDLVARARAGRLKGSEMTDPTLTVTNLGDRGVEVVHGVIYPPQVALVGLGRISTRPAVFDGQLTARRLVTATLSADHRATDGQLGGRFLNTIARLIQEPETL